MKKIVDVLGRVWPVVLCVLIAGVLGAVVPSGDTTVGGHKFAVQHPCSGNSYHMQCVTVPKTKGTVGVSAGEFGIDFGWGGPSGAQAKAAGADFGISYESNSSKDWTASNLRSWVENGRGIVFDWETSASRALDGYTAGYDDANDAVAEENSLGYPGAFTYFSVDFDTTNYSCASICPYFRGADAAIHVARVGDYGGLRTVEILTAAKLVSNSFQTLAWSGGDWSPYACIRQTSINNSFAGYSVDDDYAVCANYGQYGYTSGPPPATVKGWVAGRNSSLSAYHHWKCREPVLVGHALCHTFAGRVVYFQGKLDSSGIQTRPRCFGPTAQDAATLCQIERPAVVIWGRAKRTTQTVANSYCIASPAWGHVNVRECRILTQRIKYFARRIHSYLY